MIEDVKEAEVEQPKKSEKITKDLTKLQGELVKFETSAKEQLKVLDTTEINYMYEDNQYLTDFCMSQPIVLKFDQLKDKAMDLAKELAEKVEEQSKEMEEHHATNRELRYEYEEKLDELKELQAKVAERKNMISKANMVKLMKEESASINKDSHDVQKKFKKGEVEMDDFIESYKK